MPNPSISEQALKRARARLERQGLSIRDFADQHHLHASTVYAVLAGQKRCLRGEARRAAVLLGIKRGDVTPSVPRSPAEIH